jgi:DNA mismatch repair ATPase MutS
MKEYLRYTVNNIDEYSSQIQLYDSYNDFDGDLTLYKDKIQKFINELDELPEETKSLKTLQVFGVIMKYFYFIHYDNDIQDMMSFTFGFNGYIDTIKGLQSNIINKKINTIQFSEKDKCFFKNVHHPSLINDDPVKNDINLSKSIIITGPNAAGKTTILKSTIINLIFSQQIGYGFYDGGKLNPYKHIHCYINIPDSCSRDSLFQSEARRCKNILDIIEKNRSDRHFCVFDELYSGTNPYEAVSNAYAYLEYMISNKNVKVILTTHYLNLCKLFRKNKRIKNCSMKTIEGKSNIPTYTYKLIKGYSKTKGGIAVLKQLEYPNAIIKNAEKIIKKI